MTEKKIRKDFVTCINCWPLGNPRMSPYVASKGAVIALAKGMAKEFTGPDSNITINSLAPTTVDTQWSRQWIKSSSVDERSDSKG